MSRFFTSTTNTRKKTVGVSGGQEQTAHIRGWNAGVEIVARKSTVMGDDYDAFDVFKTGGSNGSTRVKIGSVIETESNGPMFVPGDF